jgi:hypothetical protein
LLCHRFPLHQAIFLESPGLDTADGVILALERLEESLDVVGAEALPDARHRLRRALQKQRQVWDSIVEMVWDYYDSDHPWNQELCEVGSDRARPDLYRLADEAFEEQSALSAWCAMGALIGGYQVQLHYGGADKSGQVLNRLTDLAKAIGTRDPGTPQLMQTMTRLGSKLNRTGLKVFLRKVIESCGGTIPSGDAGIESLVLGDLLVSLDDRIQEVIQKLANPRWDKDDLILWVGDLVARKVATQAVSVARVLDEFENKRWPQSIDDPLALPLRETMSVNPQILSNQVRQASTIKSLNRGLELIRFFSAGRGRKIGWKYLQIE